MKYKRNMNFEPLLRCKILSNYNLFSNIKGEEKYTYTRPQLASNLTTKWKIAKKQKLLQSSNLRGRLWNLSLSSCSYAKKDLRDIP